MNQKAHYFNIGGVPEHFNIPWRKSIDEGLFALKNIELDWHDYRGGTGDLIQALEDKTLDIAIMLTEGAIKAIADGKNFKIIQIYVNSPLIWGIYAYRTTTLTSLEDIKAPHFCISRHYSGSHLMAFLLSKKFNWALNEDSFSIIGNFIGALGNMQENPDNLFLWERFMTKPYVDSGQLTKMGEIATPWPSFSIVVREDFMNENQAVLIQMLEMIAQYTYKFKQNAQQSIEYIASFFGFSIQDMKTWLADTDWNYVLDPPELKIEGAVKLLKELGLIPFEIKAKDLCPNHNFWANTSF